LKLLRFNTLCLWFQRPSSS